jgi:hypothetical protein
LFSNLRGLKIGNQYIEYTAVLFNSAACTVSAAKTFGSSSFACDAIKELQIAEDAVNYLLSSEDFLVSRSDFTKHLLSIRDMQNDLTTLQLCKPSMSGDKALENKLFPEEDWEDCVEGTFV